MCLQEVKIRQQLAPVLLCLVTPLTVGYQHVRLMTVV
jgi:hypothetical protein